MAEQIKHLEGEGVNLYVLTMHLAVTLVFFFKLQVAACLYFTTLGFTLLGQTLLNEWLGLAYRHFLISHTIIENIFKK